MPTTRKVHGAEGKLYKCILCGFTTQVYKDLTSHKRLEHGARHNHVPCDSCPYVATTFARLKRHIDSVHKRIIQEICDQCDKVFMTLSGLRKHIRSFHEKVPYNCDECDFQTFRSDSLKEHIDFKHKGIVYYCDQCPFSTKTRGTLTTHVNIKHKGMGYHCDQCDYFSSFKPNLVTHVIRKHRAPGEPLPEDFLKKVAHKKANAKTYSFQCVFVATVQAARAHCGST